MSLTLDDYVHTIKDAFVTIATNAAKSALAVIAPAIMANPILNYIISEAIGWVIRIIADAEEMQAFFIYIDVRTSKQGRDFFEAAKANRDAKGKTEYEKAHAEADLIDRARKFFKLTN